MTNQTSIDFDDDEHMLPPVANLSADEIEEMISEAYICHSTDPEMAAAFCYIIWQETLGPYAPVHMREWMSELLDDAGVEVPEHVGPPPFDEDGREVESVERYDASFAAIIELAIATQNRNMKVLYMEALRWTDPRFGVEGIDEPEDIAWNMRDAGGLEALASTGRNHGQSYGAN
ncbi:MAG: hypothetical protein J0I99_04890 [Devosia sp.]|uniref:hypothetical protein n=1 Tax=Devosia sp. TaxID=1871048 RepID=UPI001AC7E0E9|nr:hypothetical protein [Devosia sp.]MBN9315052.1 hypothetical protein [Devosia sp.]